jgi:DNA-binding XRE family transcriptional regulator
MTNETKNFTEGETRILEMYAEGKYTQKKLADIFGWSRARMGKFLRENKK